MIERTARTTPHELIRDGIARAVAVVGLTGVALIHVLDLPDTFQAAPYKGWLYVALVVGCIVTAGTLVRVSDARAWLAAAALPLGAIVAFVISRTVGLPNSADDIGNWTEPLGLASLFVEGCVVLLSIRMLLEPAGALGVFPARTQQPVAS
jgi:hypothetical protein